MKYKPGKERKAWHERALQRGFKSEHEMLYTYYVVEGKSARQIAEMFGVSQFLIIYNMKRKGIPRRAQGGANFKGMPKNEDGFRHCLKCDKKFLTEDKKKNRICPRCNKLNRTYRFGPEACPVHCALP
jgi:hypothetical protein